MLFELEDSLEDKMESRGVRSMAMKCVKRDWTERVRSCIRCKVLTPSSQKGDPHRIVSNL